MKTALTSEQLQGIINVLEPADDLPAKRMFATSAGREMEAAEKEMRDATRKAKQNKKKGVQRAREARNAVIMKSTPEKLTADQIQESWRVIEPLWPVILRVAKEKVRQARRYGSPVEVDDVTDGVVERMRLVIHSKRKHEIDALAEAAHELAGNILRAEETGSARKWLMQRLNVIVTKQVRLADMRARKTVSLDDARHSEAIGQAIARIDSHYDNFKAARTCHLEGARFVGPGETDWVPLLVVVTEAIRAKGLDAITDIILDEALCTDGTVAWSKYAQAIFEADPEIEGAWALVEAACSNYPNPRERAGRAARRRVEALFAWMPEIVAAYAA